MEKPPVHIVLTLWGTSYIDTYLSYTIYNHFAPNNIPALLDDFVVHYTIYTFSPEIAPRLLQSEIYGALSKRVHFQVMVMPDTQLSNYGRVAMIHNLAVARASEEKAIVCFVHTDQLWADGSFRRAFDKIKEGYRSVECVLLRCSKERFVTELSGQGGPSTISDAMAIPPRRLVAMAIRNRHPAAALFPGGYIPFPGEPTIMCRYVKDEGVVMHAGHFFPFVVYPQVYSASLYSAEVDFALTMVPDRSKRYIVQDSDQVFGCDLSPDEVDWEHIASVSKFVPHTVGRYLTKEHPSWRYNFRRFSVEYHHDRQTPEAWKRARRSFMPMVLTSLGLCHLYRALDALKKRSTLLAATPFWARLQGHLRKNDRVDKRKD